MRIYAIGQDRYWLATFKRIEVKNTVFKIIECPAEFLDCVDTLPTAEVDSLILLDATGQVDIEAIVQRLRDQGWRYVIVVAADQNAKKAIAILRRSLAFDYWEKTYDIPPIQARIARIIDEINSDVESEHQKPSAKSWR